MEENKNDIELEGMMAQEPSLAEMPLTELKEVDYISRRDSPLVRIKE